MAEELTVSKTIDVSAAFKAAEGAMKFAERISCEVAIPAVNQLRYALCHVLEGDDEAAVRHCVRARYDAYEAAVGFFLDYIATFLSQDIPVATMERHLPKWREYRNLFLDSRKVLCEIRSLRDSDDAVFARIEEVLPRLAEVRDAIDGAFLEMRNDVHAEEEQERVARQRELQDREEAKAREDRRRYSLSLWWTICGTILGALGILVAFLK